MSRWKKASVGNARAAGRCIECSRRVAVPGWRRWFLPAVVVPALYSVATFFIWSWPPHFRDAQLPYWPTPALLLAGLLTAYVVHDRSPLVRA